jgi:hypothetical protein
MPLSFDTQMIRVAELFSDASVFEMPAFQRPFCWDEDTAAQLHDDISAAMVRGRPEKGARKNRQDYFLGPMIVTRDRSSGAFEVIDGQQRLVTLTILLAVLRDALPADNQFKEELQPLIVRPSHQLRRLPESPRVKLREADQASFAKWVQAPGGTKNLPEDDEESDSRSRVLAAVARIEADLDNPQPTYIKELASFILNNCYVIQITARDLDDGYVLFRSLNSRGQPLNELDLARAELLGAKLSSPDIDVEKLAQSWRDAEESLDPEEFTEYMHSVLSLVATRPQGRGLRELMKEVLGDPLKAHNFRVLLSSVLRHSSKLDEGVLEFGSDSDKIHRVVECLRHLAVREWRSVTLCWLAGNPNGFHTLQFLSALDSLCLGLQILGKPPTQVLRRLRAVTNEVNTHREKVLNQSGALRFTPAEQGQLKSILMRPISSKKRFLKSLLLRLNAHMLDATIPVYFPEVTIEHVLPQRPAANGPWPEKYPDASRRKLCTELLGNYALLTQRMNAGAKNKDFKAKRTVMFGKSSHQSFPLTADLVHYDDWTEVELLARHQKLVGLTFDVLGLPPAIAWPAAAE